MAKSETVALVGSSSLLGREVRDLLSAVRLPSELHLLAAEDDEAGTLTEQSGEPILVGMLNEEALSDSRIVFLAGSPESTKKAIRLAAGAVLVDLTGAAEDDPRARLRAPSVEPPGYDAAAAGVHVIAHPAAIVIALLLGKIQEDFQLRRSVIHILEPASERGQKGLDELQQQTVNLFSFKGLPRDVFDAQLSFNMLARYGEEAPQPLEEVETRIERHVATLLSIASPAPLPSLRLLQAPVFHGHSFSLWVEFEKNPGAAELESTLLSAGIDVRTSDLEPPSIVGMAGQSGVAAGAISVDRNYPSACWIWAVADNIRLVAENAVAVARQLL